jgi:hypothetical protein
VIALALNAFAQLLMMQAYPPWSLSLFALDILAIYGLVAYGSRISGSSHRRKLGVTNSVRDAG